MDLLPKKSWNYVILGLSSLTSVGKGAGASWIRGQAVGAKCQALELVVGQTWSWFVALLAAKQARKPAKRPQKPAKRAQVPNCGSIGVDCMHCPLKKHALIGHRCRVNGKCKHRERKLCCYDVRSFVLVFQRFVLERPVFLQSYPLPKTPRNFWVFESPEKTITT